MHGSFGRLRPFSLIFTVACTGLYAFSQDVSKTQQLHLREAAGSIHGTIKDPLGAVVVNASVELIDANEIVLSATHTDAFGRYHLVMPSTGYYSVRSTALTFKPAAAPLRFFAAVGDTSVDLMLATPTLTEQITVTAVGTPTPIAQVGVPLTVLNSEDYRYASEVQASLRTVAGLQLTQTGQMGGTTSLFIRGGNDNGNKVLIDGIPSNDIGGAVEFGDLDAVGLQKIEVLREPNSALYGSDALAGVVSLTTARGTTRLPQLSYSGSGGNFGTYRNEVEAGETIRRFDYYSAFARIDSGNNQPNDSFHNATYAGNFGWTPNASNDFRFTLRHLAESAGQPNATALFGMADAAGVKERDSYYGAAWNNQASEKWHNQIRYGGLRLRYQYTDYAPTGVYIADSDFYLGAPVRISGANGYSVSGQAIFQYGASYGSSYPSQYTAPTRRDFVYAQTDYRLNPHTVALAAFKYEDERGSTLSSGSKPTSIERGNYSYTLQIAGDIRNRLYYAAGSGLEDNGLFGFAATPRVSLAYYLRRPWTSTVLGGTKLHFSFGKGIKEPSIYNQSISLYGTFAALPNGRELIAQYHVSPIGPEDSRTFDGGVDQELWNGRVRVGATYFHNEFTNGVEFVPQSALLKLGVPAANDPAVQFGAAVNSQAFRAQGAELEVEYRINSHLFARGGYTYLDAVVQRSFSSQSDPVFNTQSSFSSIPIGQYSPLVGARPFRRAPHSGYFAINYTRTNLDASLTGTMVGRRDDSDFLTDANFGNNLLLPNRNLLGAYQKLDFGIGYQLTHLFKAYAAVQNALSEHYAEAFGYPSLPLTFRSGIKVTFGGESWKVR
jgi:vitamin B12 transporter